MQPRLLLPLGGSRELTFVRRNASAPALPASDVRFTGLEIASQRQVAANGGLLASC